MHGNNLSLSFGLQQIFDEVTFMINENDKVGIIGVNGAGKSTLFKIIMGELEPDQGYIKVSKNKILGWLPQIVDDAKTKQDMTVLDFLLSGRPTKEILFELETLYNEVAETTNEREQKRLLTKIGRLQDQFEHLGGYNAENILFEIIMGMNIDYEILDLKLKNLSGGQKSKIAFIRLLYSNPDVLLLDEPTNHLDKVSKDFIIEYLKKYKGMILVISHDTDFLDEVTNKTMYIDKITHKIYTYTGNYSRFLKLKQEEQRNIERMIVTQEREEKKLKDLINLYSNSSGKRKRMSQSREKTLAKLLEHKIEVPKEDKQVKIKLQPLRETSTIPLAVKNVTFKYPNSDIIIDNLSFTIDRNEKFLVLGLNGAGKSTLFKLIMNILTPQSGEIIFGPKVDIAYYAQEHEGLDNNLSVIESVQTEKYTPNQIRSILGNFLFSSNEVYKKIQVLSPGERSRVALAKLVISGANLLLLDEPTNHLDPKTQAIIGDTLKDYKGTMLVISHNLEFVDRIGIERMLILPEGKIEYYNPKKVRYYQEQNTKEVNK
jgi:ATP-binding cassette subfamily F protein 3